MRAGTCFALSGALLFGLAACGVSKGPTKKGDTGDSKSSAGGSTASSGAGQGSGGAGVTSGVGGLDIHMTYMNPCTLPGAPPNCTTMTAPGCGDGAINQASEQCDDGNALPGDGCSGVCTLEPYFTCPTPGMPCVSTIICGDGIVGPGELCDDGNMVSDDGCSSTCRKVEKGYRCLTPGMPCERVHSCGDGAVDPSEGCDDGNNVGGDGCDAHCRLETGFKCSGAPSTCTATVCGDGNKEGAESCDDGNKTPFDGCSVACQTEPSCGATSGCTSTCGDGIVLGGEQCDDGNLRDGDGCSSTCQIESGFTCNNDAGACKLAANGQCTMTVPAIFRDLAAGSAPPANPDFEPPYDVQTATTGLVATALGADGKPVLANPASMNGYIHSAASFNQWYHDAPPNNATYPGSILLWNKNTDGTGPYVNRWGANGEQWPSYSNIAWCANGGAGVTCASVPACTLAGAVCLNPCTPWGNTTQLCTATVTYIDGNPVFFPIDNLPGLIPETRSTATIPQQVYNGNWAAEPGGALHNFNFTSEIRYWFKYDPAAAATLDFVGDDDVWVFVNQKLALDLGGWHVPIESSFTLNATTATTYNNLKSGNVYEIAVFQTERKVTGSSFKLSLSGFNVAPSDCTAKCGDGTIAGGEACDNGANNSDTAYNGCTTMCTPGPTCGDGVVQMPEETCDDGVNSGDYGKCGPNCQAGPFCGDGVRQVGSEACDDGKNDGTYGTCNPDCTLAPHCGDGAVDMANGEECDDANIVNGDGCNSACKLEMIH